MRVFFSLLLSFIMIMSSCTDPEPLTLLDPIPADRVRGMIDKYRSPEVLISDRPSQGEDKGTLWSEFKVDDLRLLLEQFADEDKVRLVTAANEADNSPTILFQIVSGTVDAPVQKFYRPLASGVCPEPFGCAGEVHPAGSR